MMAAPIVGENSIGIRLAWRSFQAVTSCSASSRICGPRARRAAASLAATAARWLSIRRLLKPLADLTLGRGNRSMPLYFGYAWADLRL